MPTLSAGQGVDGTTPRARPAIQSVMEPPPGGSRTGPQAAQDPVIDGSTGWTEWSPASDDVGVGGRVIQPSLRPAGDARWRQEPDDGQLLPSPDSTDCDAYRRALLENSIVDIALDISPPRRVKGRGQRGDLIRQWTDRFGNPMLSGRLLDLRRGYLIIESDQGTQRVSFSRISEADLAALADYWEIPMECLVSTGQFIDRCWTPQNVHWHASALCHKTLFFEDVKLERYGQSDGPLMQPLRSTAHFFVSLLTVPYQAGIHPPNECQYALGYYRPGNCAPWLRDPLPISLSGAAHQAAIVTGGAFVLP